MINTIFLVPEFIDGLDPSTRLTLKSVHSSPEAFKALAAICAWPFFELAQDPLLSEDSIYTFTKAFRKDKKMNGLLHRSILYFIALCESIDPLELEIGSYYSVTAD